MFHSAFLCVFFFCFGLLPTSIYFCMCVLTIKIRFYSVNAFESILYWLIISGNYCHLERMTFVKSYQDLDYLQTYKEHSNRSLIGHFITVLHLIYIVTSGLC